jgi:glycosyltransferase involved in cell wall biosynthesis
MLQPYRLTFYEKLAAFSPKLSWNVYHGIKLAEDGRPAYTGQTSFRNTGIIEKILYVGPFKIRIHKGLVQEIVRFDPDLVIIQGMTGNISYRRLVNWAKRNHRGIFIWTCGWEPGLAKGMLLHFKNYFVSSFFKKGNTFFSYSTKAVQYIMDRGVPRDRIKVCYNGIETDTLMKNEPEVRTKSEHIKQTYSLHDHTVFLYVGGLLPEKNVDLLLDAFMIVASRHARVKLMIIGDGPLRQEISEKITAMQDDRIIYLGRIMEDVDQYFAASTCFVLPGAGGLALNQAMFWSKPCIVSEADGTEDDLVIDGVTGFRFIKDNLSDLAEAMEKFIRTEARTLEYMGKGARDIILQKSNVNNMVKVFTHAVLDYFPELKSTSAGDN